MVYRTPFPPPFFFFFLTSGSLYACFIHTNLSTKFSLRLDLEETIDADLTHFTGLVYVRNYLVDPEALVALCPCGSVAKLCLTLCNLMNCSMPGFSVFYHLPELF